MRRGTVLAQRLAGSLGRMLPFAAGLAIFAGLSVWVGAQEIGARLYPLGWSVALVFVPYLVIFPLDALGWRYSFARPIPVGWLRLTGLQVIGKAFNTLTPLVPAGGEPVKAYLLQQTGVSLTEGLASVVVSRTLMTIAQGIFILGATALIGSRFGLGVPLMQAMAVVILTGLALVGAFVLAQTRGLFSRLIGLIGARRLGSSSVAVSALDLDRRISEYYRRRWSRLSLALTFHLLGWLAEGLEVYLLLALLDLDPTLVLAFGVAAFSSAVRAASFFIPGSLGIQEGGNVVILASLGLPPDTAMAFSVLRRLREWGWTAAGFVLLGWLGRRLRVPLASASAPAH
jgi:uncharacterized protein (TIRG00374 family)